MSTSMTEKDKFLITSPLRNIASNTSSTRSSLVTWLLIINYLLIHLTKARKRDTCAHPIMRRVSSEK